MRQDGENGFAPAPRSAIRQNDYEIALVNEAADISCEDPVLVKEALGGSGATEWVHENGCPARCRKILLHELGPRALGIGRSRAGENRLGERHLLGYPLRQAKLGHQPKTGLVDAAE